MSENPIYGYRIGWTTHGNWRNNVKHLAFPHRPWQAECEGLLYARRGLTKASAVRRVQRDVDYAVGRVTGHPVDSPAQLRLRYLASLPLRRWWRRRKARTYPGPPQPRRRTEEPDRG